LIPDEENYISLLLFIGIIGLDPYEFLNNYVEKVLIHFGYKDNKHSPTTYDHSLVLWKNKRIGRDQLRYSHIIRSLIILASVTRPNISFAVSKLTQFTSNPGDNHWRATEQVMHYLTSTMDYIIHYSWYPTVLKRYIYANQIFDVDELYVTSRYVFTLGDAAISWRLCKQTILTRSTMEAELAALDTTTVETDYVCELLIDLPIVEKLLMVILMNCDNPSVIVKVDS
jgi:hypothetical protein